MEHNRYEWQLSFDTDGVEAKCVLNPDSPDEQIIDSLPISDDPKMSWPQAQEEAKSVLRLKCTRDIINNEWDDLQAAMYAISNQKWLEHKILDAAKRRWPDDKIAEQWLILGALAVNNSTYKKWVDKLMPSQEEPLLHKAWITWPGELQNQILYSLNYLINITNCSNIRTYSLPDISVLYTFKGNRLISFEWKKVSGDHEIWEIWQTENTYIIRSLTQNGWIYSRAPLKKNLSAEETIDILIKSWQLNIKNPKLTDKLKALVKVASILKLDQKTLIKHIVQVDEKIIEVLIKILYPDKSIAWYETIALNKNAEDLLNAIKELDQLN